MESIARVAAGCMAQSRISGANVASDDTVHRLYELVSARLADDPVLALMVRQAQASGVTSRTLRRLTDSITEVAESDAAFAGRLDRLVRELRQCEPATTASGERSVGIGGNNSGIVATGDDAVNIQR